MFKIAITGGPCAGKTTSMSNLEQILTERGYHVLIIDEAATSLINGGIRPFGENSLTSKDFQRIVLKLQDSKESVFNEVEKFYGKPVVLICDRGMLDGDAYYDDFESLLIEEGFSRETLFSRYDIVIHLTTAAIGAPEFYTLENNVARYEATIELAAQADSRTKNAWIGHHNLHVIDNSTNFENKIKRTTNIILSNLSEPENNDLRYLADINVKDLKKLITSKINSHEGRLIEIEQYYLISNNPKLERRIRRRTINNSSSFYYCEKILNDECLPIVKKERHISKSEYIALLNDKVKVIHKKRFCFYHNSIIYNLDIFDGDNEIDKVIIETNQSHNSLVNSMSFLNANNIVEITNVPNYRNYNLAKPI